MMKKIIYLCIITLSCIMLLTIPVKAKNFNGHKEDFEAVIFGDRKLSEKESNIAQAIAEAAFLTIDQYKTLGQNSLDYFSKFGVRNLPTLEEISIEGGGKHRLYAHNGWDSEYHPLKYRNRYKDSAWTKKWKIRKGIIEKTVNKAFDFNWWGSIPLVGDKLPDSNEECDSFCALIYYIHLLGDHVETHTMDQYELLMPIGGSALNDTIVSELEYHCEVLFESQVDTFEYEQLESALWDIDSKCVKQGNITEDKLQDNQKLAETLLEKLEENIPALLERETFFKKVIDDKKAA